MWPEGSGMRPKSLRCAGVAAVLCGLLAARLRPDGAGARLCAAARPTSPGSGPASTTRDGRGDPRPAVVERRPARFGLVLRAEHGRELSPTIRRGWSTARCWRSTSTSAASCASIERYGLEDGRIVNLTTRTTETGGRELGVLEQLFGNLLNLDAEALNAAGQ